MTSSLKLASVILALCLSALALAGSQQDSVKTSWTPPSSRIAKTPLAPKPFAGDNIFKGEAEVWLADALETLQGGIFEPIDDKVVTEYVNRVGKNLALFSLDPKKQYEFIVTTDLTPDAMTVGGGRIYITEAMLAEVESEDELSGLLAHEIAHDAFAHIPKTITRQMFWLTGTRKVNTGGEVQIAVAKLFAKLEQKPVAVVGESLLGFSRFDELEADRAAFYNTYKAGYNPYALATVLKRLACEQQEEMGTEQYRRHQFLMLLLGSHPPTAQRSMALSWESNFVKMPPKNSVYHSAAFADMKRRITEMQEVDG